MANTITTNHKDCKPLISFELLEFSNMNHWRQFELTNEKFIRFMFDHIKDYKDNSKRRACLRDLIPKIVKRVPHAPDWTMIDSICLYWRDLNLQTRFWLFNEFSVLKERMLIQDAFKLPKYRVINNWIKNYKKTNEWNKRTQKFEPIDDHEVKPLNDLVMLRFVSPKHWKFFNLDDEKIVRFIFNNIDKSKLRKCGKQINRVFKILINKEKSFEFAMNAIVNDHWFSLVDPLKVEVINKYPQFKTQIFKQDANAVKVWFKWYKNLHSWNKQEQTFRPKDCHEVVPLHDDVLLTFSHPQHWKFFDLADKLNVGFMFDVINDTMLKFKNKHLVRLFNQLIDGLTKHEFAVNDMVSKYWTRLDTDHQVKIIFYYPQFKEQIFKQDKNIINNVFDEFKRIHKWREYVSNTFGDGFKLNDDILLNYAYICQWKYFDRSNERNLKFMFESINDLNKVVNRNDLVKLFNILIDEKTDFLWIVEELIEKYWNMLTDEYHLKITDCLKYIQFKESILDKHNDFVNLWFNHNIETKRIDDENFKDLYAKYKDNLKDVEVAHTWIRVYHEEPPFEVYLDPNHSHFNGQNFADAWRKYVSSDTVPMEMTSMKYWIFMHNSGGHRQSPDHTIMWTFFSNSKCNKIIFARSDVEFTEPARNRCFIPIDYERVKPFLHERLITNNICRFTEVTARDWNKIAGGRDDFDVVAFSDFKNIQEERTPLQEIVEYIMEQLEIFFDTQLVMPEI